MSKINRNFWFGSSLFKSRFDSLEHLQQLSLTDVFHAVNNRKTNTQTRFFLFSFYWWIKIWLCIYNVCSNKSNDLMKQLSLRNIKRIDFFGQFFVFFFCVFSRIL